MPTTSRLRALDLFRGLTVAGMIIVNCSGSDEVFPMVDHAPWQGMTLADLVFPSFLLVLGISAALSHARRRGGGQDRNQVWRASLLRAAGLFALGLLVNAVVFREAGGGIRWPGVLQRIAFCALGVSSFLYLDIPRLEPLFVGAVLIGYWLLLTRVPVPGVGAGVLTPAGNFASWLDRRLIGGHLQTPLSDPEGLLSTLPAFTTSVIGLVVGRRLAASTDPTRQASRLMATGVGLAVVGAVWEIYFPFNKHIWTSSFALFSTGVCLAAFGGLLQLYAESEPHGAGAFEALGRHALAAYVLTGFVYGIFEFIPARLADGSSANVKLWLNAHLFASWLPPRFASLAFAFAFTAAAALVALRAARPRA